jgi:hypothetical protein
MHRPGPVVHRAGSVRSQKGKFLSLHMKIATVSRPLRAIKGTLGTSYQY